MTPRRAIIWPCALLALAVGANLAPAQATRPAPLDAYKDVPLPRTAPASQAAVGAPRPAPSSDPLDTKRVAIALGIVLLAIYGAHRAWRRLGMPGSANRAGQTLQVMSRLVISPRQQILLIRVGRRFVLVGNSGTQMNPLCEIADPEEAAALLGQTVTDSKQSVSAAFSEVLDDARRQFDVDLPPASPRQSPDGEEAEHPTLAATREELGAMMDKVRSLSKQFQTGAPDRG